MKAIAIVFIAGCGLLSAGAPEGKAAIAKMYSVEMHPLASKEIQSKSNADIKKTITAGQGKMKPVSGLSDKQIEDVIAFVRTLK